MPFGADDQNGTAKAFRLLSSPMLSGKGGERRAFYPCQKVRFRLSSAIRKTNMWSVALGHLFYHFGADLPQNDTLGNASEIVKKYVLVLMFFISVGAKNVVL